MRFPYDKFISLFKPYIPSEVIGEVMGTLMSGWVGQGKKVYQFEHDFAEKFNQKYCVAMNSGTSALETAFGLVGIQPGDEVITTPLTATCANIALLRMGAKIVWADIDKETLCLNRQDVINKTTSKTKAIVNVHLGGIESDIGEMFVPVISDSCQALGIFSGDYTCNSFQAIKHITTGDGGMLTVNNEEEYKKAKLMRWFGIDRENIKVDYKIRTMTAEPELLGYKRQMNDIAAGMGISGLKHYAEVIAHRYKLFQLYKKLLKVPVIDGKRNTYWLCTVLLENRDEVAEKLFKNGVETNLVHVRNDSMKIFGGRADLPTMDWVESRYLCLPLNMQTTEEDVIKISDLINSWTQ